MVCLFLLEYNVLQPSPLNEKVLRDKRKKLKETFDRVMRLYVSHFKTFIKFFIKNCYFYLFIAQ